jgi:hypothetical protein
MNYLDTSTLTHPPITVIDAIMGAGKTTWIIDYMNRLLGQHHLNATGLKPRFIYVTPLLEETDRIRSACPIGLFKNPVPTHGRKFYDFKKLLEKGENISTTHQLFRQLDRECYELIKGQGYTLIIDEALNCLELYEDLSSADFKVLLDHNMVYIEADSSKLRWNYADFPDYTGKFEGIKSLCDNGNLVVYGEGSDRKILIWEFAGDFLYSFSDIFILTYLYQGSPMSLYLQSEGFKVDMMSVSKGSVIPHNMVNQAEIKAKLRSLLTVYEGPKNSIGERETGRGSFPFSSTWLETEKDKYMNGKLPYVRGVVTKWFERDAGTPSSQNAWTTMKKAQRLLQGPRYARGFIPINAKATNDYAHKTSLAYLANVYYHTIIKQFFQKKGLPVLEDLHALSEMVQWIFRSAVRNGQPIKVFIPSPRMRSLLQDWLYHDSDHELAEKIEAEREAKMKAAQKAARIETQQKNKQLFSVLK